MEAAKKALVPPFGLSRFADPAGSFTTAAALVACVEKTLREKQHRDLRGLKVIVFGATGVVGFSSGVIAALEGAAVVLVGHDGIRRVGDAAKEIKTRFGVDVTPVDGSDDAKKAGILADAHVVISAGRAGVRVISKAQLEAARNLLVASDVNAVPPSGIEGLDVNANGTPLTSAGALGIGPLAIGGVKYKTEFGLFQNMISASKPVHFDFRDAFKLARELNA
jgi:methylene-tetrahydromethanopterin dehydrogenase